MRFLMKLVVFATLGSVLVSNATRASELDISKQPQPLWPLLEPDVDTDLIILYDDSETTNSHMVLGNFLDQVESLVTPGVVPLVQVMATAGQVIPDTSTAAPWTAVAFDTPILQTEAGMHSSANPTRLVAPRSGQYAFGAVVEFDTASLSAASYYYAAMVGKNGVASDYSALALSRRRETCKVRTLNLAGSVQLDEGDYIELFVIQDSNTNKTLKLRSHMPSFYMYWLRE